MQKCLLTSYTYDVLLKPVSQVDVDVGGFVDGEGLEGVDGVPDGRRLRESGGQQHKREREREVVLTLIISHANANSLWAQKLQCDQIWRFFGLWATF